MDNGIGLLPLEGALSVARRVSVASRGLVLGFVRGS